MAEVTEIGKAGAVRSLDARYYTDPAIFHEEIEKIFFTTWQYAGHVSQIPAPGDYFAFELFDQSLFTIRGRDGEIRSFYNVCKHRAHRMVEGAGNKRLLVCPYHAWSYELDGRLRRAPNQDRAAGFDPAGICLSEVRTESFCGFIFVNLDGQTRPMADWFPNVEAELHAFVPDIDRLAPVETIPVEERCNWKVTVENYSECYHCKINHPTFANGVIDPTSYNIMAQGHCLRHTTRSANLERMTYQIDPAANAHAADYSSWFLWPAFSFQVYPGNLLNTYLWRPLDVGRTMVYRGWYGIDGTGSDMLAKLARQDRETTVEEDIRLVESVQRGLASRGYGSGPLIVDPEFGVNSEHTIEALQSWVREALGR